MKQYFTISGECADIKIDECHDWSKETWFLHYCSGDFKNDTAYGYFGGTTLSAVCEKSCDLCEKGNI